jgi:prevent-host-death family protein
MAVQMDIQDVGAHLADLMERVRRGEEITIAEAGQPVAKLVPVTREARQRAFGLFKDQVWIADDFDAPLSEEELREWEG